MSSSSTMHLLSSKIIAVRTAQHIPGIVAETGLSHDYLNIFYEYYGHARLIYRHYRERSLEKKELNLLIKELKRMKELSTYSEWVSSHKNAQEHLDANRAEIEMIDRSIHVIRQLIDQEWHDRRLFKNFRKIVALFNENILPVIDPSREPQPLQLAYSDPIPEKNGSVLFF